MEFLSMYQKYIDNALTDANQGESPQGLYAPIDYLLSLGVSVFVPH